MSFTSKTKEELCKGINAYAHCDFAEVYGFLLFGKSFTKDSIQVVLENKFVLERFQKLIKNIFSAESVISHDEKGRRYKLDIPSESDRERILSEYMHSEKEIALSIKEANIEYDCCLSAFLRGVFLSCGNLSDPNIAYRIEFPVHHLSLCIQFIEFLSENSVIAKFVERNGRYIVYTKESSVVEDLLVFIGAHNASLEIMNVKILKDIRNKVNRVTNFETANIDKTLSASKKQTDCINYLLKNMAPGYISDELYKTALLRIENPDATLKELCSMTEPPVSRSGMNHRLSKLCELSDALRKGGKKK